MTSLWWRSWHGAPTDPKWIAIAKRSETQPGFVSAVAWALFDHASQQEERGDVSRFDAETYAAFSGFEQAVIERIIDAMREKELIVNNRLSAWQVRQPKREDDNSTERVKRYRERNATKRNETHGNAILDKIREDKKDSKEQPRRKKPKSNISDSWLPTVASTQKAQKLGLTPHDIGREAEKFRNHARQNERQCVNWDAAFDNWCINAVDFKGIMPPEERAEVFAAFPASPEFQAWKAHAKDVGKHSLTRELDKRELEGRPFNFESRWPPGFKAAQ